MSELLNTIVAAIDDKKGQQIVSMDLRGVDGAICDYFVVCNADSSTQVCAIADGVEEKTFLDLNDKVFRVEGMNNGIWVVMDYGDVMVHIFETTARSFYALEDLWGDAPMVKYEPQH